MKIKIFIIPFILLMGVTFATAQRELNHGLILTGKIYDGKKETHKDFMFWKAKLAMEFVNKGVKPIILINAQGQFGQWQSRVSFSTDKDYGKSADFKFSKKIDRKVNDPEQLKNLAGLLKDEKPPENSVVIIKPSESFHFEDILEVKQKIFYGERCCKYFEGTSRDGGYIPLGSLPYLTIEYEISLVKYQVEPDLLEDLRAKWQKFGILPIDPNGGFSIISEPILNDCLYQAETNDK